VHPSKTSPSAWDDQFVRLDEGRLHIHREFLPALRDRGWTTAHHILDAQDVDVFRQLPDRENARVTFAGTGEPWHAYLKRHAPARHGTHPTPGLEEAQASRWCSEAGVGIAPVIAYGADDRRRSFFLSQNLAGFEPADDWLRRVEQEGADLERIRSLFRSLGRTIGRLHAARLFHRDLYWCHLFVREPKAGQFDVRLIDLQRIHWAKSRTWRWRLKDLGQFAFAFPTGWGNDADLADWFASYLGQDQLGTVGRILLRAVRVRARFYAWREQHRQRTRPSAKPSPRRRDAA
jgi:heptose I phosphotransferase